VQKGFVTILALLAASFVLVWPFLALRRSARSAGSAVATDPGGPFTPRRVALLLGLACVLQMVSLAGLSYWVSEPQSALLAFGIPPTLEMLKWVAFATMLMLPLLCVSVLEAWRCSFWSLSARTHFSTVAVGVAAFSAYAVYIGIIAV
jgi:hypothetical protein